MANSDLESFLSEPNVAVLATVDRKGRPHAAPIWYLYEDGEFIISTGNGSQKHRNVEGNPNVTIVIDRRTIPYFAAMAQGAATIGPSMDSPMRLRLAIRYLGEELGRGYVASMPDAEGITVRLRPTKIIEYNGRAGRS
jgi:PPOX class probable F420-dependent enzyme